MGGARPPQALRHHSINQLGFSSHAGWRPDAAAAAGGRLLLGVAAVEAAISTYRSTTAIVRAEAHRAASAAKTAAMELAINATASAITHGITALACATSAALAAVDAVQAAMRSLEVWRKGDDAFTGSSLVYHKLMQNAKPNPCAHTL